MSKQELIRLDHMTVQYIWSLENDQVFVAKAKHEVDRGDFDRFRTLVQVAIRPTRQLLDEAHTEGINGYEWSFLYLEMWWRMGGGYAGASGFHVDRLRTAGYRISERGVIRISERGVIRINTAEKDLNQYLQGVKAVVAATDALVSSNPCAEIELGQPQTCTLENEMSNHITIVNKTLINGVDVATMSDGQLIDAIKRVEKEIEELKSVKTQSKKIAAKVEEANKTLTALVELLDGR